MIELRTPAEIEQMKPAGRFVADVLTRLAQAADVGVNLLDLDELAHDLIREHAVREDGAGGMMLFQTMQQGSSTVAAVPADHPFHVPGTYDPPAYFDDPGYPKMHFIEREFSGDWTNWWAPNRACSEAMLRAAGFVVEAHPEHDVYLCRVAPVRYAEYGSAAVYPATPDADGGAR